jgi:hypothetical protein
MKKKTRVRKKAMEIKRKVFNIKSFVIASLRRASYRYPPREEARRKAKVDRNQYKCASCGNIFKRKDTKIDHIAAVVDPKMGWVSFDSFIDRLFCPVDGFQVLCKEDHDKKTKEEGVIRRTHKFLANKSKL